MALTDKAVRNLKPKPAPYKKGDGEGLYLLVTPGGSKLWHLAYRFAGKQKAIALGSYPVVTLAMARESKAEAKRLLAQGVDPSEKRKADKRAAAAARTFGEVADEWFEARRKPEGKSEATLKRDRWLKDEWKSEIGRRLIAKIEPPELHRVLEKVQARKHYETASRMRTLASEVFRFGIWKGYCGRDMAADLNNSTPCQPEVKEAQAAVKPTVGVHQESLSQEDCVQRASIVVRRLSIRLGPFLKQEASLPTDR